MRRLALLFLMLLAACSPSEQSLVLSWSEEGYQLGYQTVANGVSDEAWDLTGNQISEGYQLTDGRLRVVEEGDLLWESPEDWQVDHFVIADSTHDGKLELNMSVWKPGDFGPSKPFWVEENDMSVKQHFFVFGLKESELRPVWQSSNLTKPNCDFLFSDVNQDGKQELVVIEGEYEEDRRCEGKHVAVWYWNQWGFFNDWRSEAGEFKNLRLNEDRQVIME